MTQSAFFTEQYKKGFKKVLDENGYRCFKEQVDIVLFRLCIGKSEWSNDEIKERGWIILGYDDTVYQNATCEIAKHIL